MSGATYDFSGKSAIVTGGSKGIGREVSLRLAAAGCRVGATARTVGELETLQSEIGASQAACEVFPCDLTDPGQIDAMTAHFIETFGRIDFLVNNAGTTYPEPFLQTNLEHWDITMAVNLRAPMIVARNVARNMADHGGGSIVQISSLSGVVGIEDHAAYCASKFGLHGMAKVMALELGPLGIRVNSVAPTVVLTPMGLKVWGDPKVGDPMKAKIPLGRFVEPSDVADAVLFLLSDAAATVHGDVLMLDGGYTAR
jgi:L-xylulose reductase